MADEREVNHGSESTTPPMEYATHLALLARYSAPAAGTDPEAESAARHALLAIGTGAVGATPDERLKALALILGIGRSNKTLKKIAEAQLKSVLAMPLAGLDRIADRKAQVSACICISKQKSAWVPDYLAASAISPAALPPTRLAAMSALFIQCATWADVFGSLQRALAGIDGSMLPAKVQAIAQNGIGGFRTAISKSSADPGVGFVMAVRDFLAKCMDGDPSIDKRPTWKSVGNEVVLLVDAAAARHPEVLFQAGLDALLNDARKLVPKSKLTPAGEAAWAAIIARLAELVVRLANRGVAGTDLLSAAERLGGSREAILKLTRRMTKNIEPATPALATFLSEGYLPRESVQELNQSDDSTLATLLLRAAELLSIEAVSRSQSGSPLSIAHALAIEVQTLARRRGLKIVGRVGESVQYSPIQHRFAGRTEERPGIVRIAVPAVVRETGEIVSPAIVDADPREGEDDRRA